MFQLEPHPVKPMCVILAALSLCLGALAASARQQDAQPRPDAEVAQPPADPSAEAAPPADAPPADAPPADAPPADEPTSDTTAQAERAIATPTEEADKPYVEPMLAERLYEMAQSLLRQENVTEPRWRQAAALLHAASRISPKDTRFPRLLVEARMKVGDKEGAIAALTSYRRVDPADRVAQIQLIDLYIERMQSADQRLAYLRELLERQTIPQEVRSHVAAQCAHLLLERSQDEASTMLHESLKLYPLNPDALRLKLEMLAPDAAPAARVDVLMAMLRSNAAQPHVASELARVLGSVGLHQASLEWYSVALGLFPRTGRQFPPGFVADAGAQVLLAGQGEQLDVLLGSYLKARPDDADAWFLKLAKEKATADKVDPKSVEEVRTALAVNLSEVCTAIASGDGVGTTQPVAPGNAGVPAASAPGTATAGGNATRGASPSVDGPAPTTRPATAAEAMAAATRVKAGEAPDWEAGFISALTDLAFLELYFAEDAAAAANWVGVVREVLPADSVTLARLEGWVDLVSGNGEQAKAKLAPIAEEDPLAAVGMVRLAAQDAGGQAEATALATTLLSTHRTGLVGALVWSALRDRNIKPPEAEGAADVRAVVEKFPREWMEIINQPEAYYEVIAEVARVAHRYREPMMGRITIRNKTDFDLTIGPDGMIRPDLWFDARISGLVNKSFPGVAYDRIARHVVLPARGVINQMVRIDQGALADSLDQNPSASAQVTANVLTNPSPLASGIGPGPGGQRRVFNKAFVRSGFALSQNAMRKRVTTVIQNGTPSEKIRGLDLLAGYVRLLSRQKELDDSMRKIGIEFVNAVSATRSDASKPVAMYAKYVTARLVDKGREELIDSMLVDEAWPARLLALLAAADLGPQKLEEVAARLSEQDPEPSVKEYAAATVDVLRSAPATQPGTADGAPVPVPQGANAQTTGSMQQGNPSGPGPSTPADAPRDGAPRR